ncbi:MAG TPA: hypothetical protein VII51_11275 [Gaiellaceae bacterium]
MIRNRIRRLYDDESGFAIVLAVALTMLIAIIAVALTLQVMGEDSNSRRDQSQDGAYQAAEAGTNAYLSDITESSAFYTAYMAKGEATRTDSANAAHANNCSAVGASGTSTCPDAVWNSASWGTKWTYATSKTTDTGWFSIGNGYQYLIQVYPPDQSLTGLAQVITRIDVTGRPTGGTDITRWRTIETVLRPSSLADFEAFVATNLSYASGATTTGPVFVGESNSGVAGNLNHSGTAKANLYAEGTVTVGGSTLTNGAKKYDKTTSPTALCKLNNCTAVPFTNFSSTFTTVAGAAGYGGIVLAATDPGNAALSSQSPAYTVDAWKLSFQSNGTVIISSCKKFKSSGGTIFEDYNGSTAPVCGNPVTKTVPTNGAIYSTPDVLISGIVKGKVTVATAGDVVFAGNTTYNANGTDVLGVEATGTIYVAQWARDANGSITIYAAEFALNGLFEADPNYSGSISGGSVMNFYGSTAVYGGSCGGADCTIIFSNMFNTRVYNYDNNLLFVQPPYWPSLGNAYTILLQRQL